MTSNIRNNQTHRAAMLSCNLPNPCQRKQVAALILLNELTQDAVAEVFQMYHAELACREVPRYRLTTI